MILTSKRNRGLRHQVLPEPIEGQTEFIVIGLMINDHFLFIVNDAPQTANCSRNGQTITFTPGVSAGSRIVVYN